MVMNALTCMLALGLQGGVSVEDQISSALHNAGLTTASARFDPGMLTLFRSGEFTTPLYDAASQDPWKAPFLFDVFTSDLQGAAGKPNDLLNIGTRYVGIGSRRTLIGDPIASQREKAKSPNPLMQERSLLKGSLSPKDLAGVPAEVQQAAALVLFTAQQANSFYHLAVGSLESRLGADEAAIQSAMKDDSAPDVFRGGLQVFRQIDAAYMVAGAQDLVLAAQDAAELIKNVPATTRYHVEINTTLGQIVLSGGQDDTYVGSKNTLLIIDTGGSDRYVNAPSAGPTSNWAGVVIDTAANDSYLSDPALAATPVSNWSGRKNPGIEPGPIGALFGYAILFDLQGDDLYRSHRCGIASGREGVAVLEDWQGNDTYDGYMDSIGFGMFGAGILEDRGGNDTYNGFTQVEGVGQTAGLGALLDRGGNDRYIANDEVIDFPSAQSDKHNNSMAQGAGNGTRRDYLDAHSLAGGIGVLEDSGGDDRYSGAVFAQGVGYLEGIGIVRDMGGNDQYDAGWYAQGASAHFAVGYLRDDAGDDVYNATMNMAQGAGHDFGAGYLLDLAGNDRYTAPNLSLGAGNANGIGLLMDLAGNDRYQSSGLTLGQSGDSPKGSLRSRALCLGVFVDLGGVDTYPTSFAWAKNNGSQVNWTGKSRVPEESQLGVFWDQG